MGEFQLTFALGRIPISTYLSVSLVFWWTGLLPDFAMIRDRAVRPFQKKIYSLLSFGWSGRAKDWQRFEEVSLVLAGLATPLVLSVHTIVSFDFALGYSRMAHYHFPSLFCGRGNFLWFCYGKYPFDHYAGVN